MPVTHLQVLETGVSSSVPRTPASLKNDPASIVLINTNDTVATVTSTGYLNDAKKLYGNNLLDKSFAIVYTTDEGQQPYQISISGNNTSLIAAEGSVTLPVTDGNFAIFSGTNGTLKDAGYSATNAAKTKVVMADAATVVDELAAFADTAGTVKTTGVVANTVLWTGIATPDENANLIGFDITVDAASLASAGSVTLHASTGAKQYKIRSLFINSGGTNFSGGGGDRLLSITDGTTDYSVIPAATLQALVNAGWGDGTDLPYPASAAISTSTVAGASLVATYSGGAADYGAGSVVISGVIERVA